MPLIERQASFAGKMRTWLRRRTDTAAQMRSETQFTAPERSADVRAGNSHRMSRHIFCERFVGTKDVTLAVYRVRSLADSEGG